jgi:hypothetical protein
MSFALRGGLAAGCPLIGILLVTGCVRSRVTVFDPRSGADRRTPTQNIRFYELQRPTCAYRELGHVTANSSFFGSWNKVQRKAREKAHELGGNAIVSVREQSRVTGAVFSKSQISATETTSLSEW